MWEKGTGVTHFEKARTTDGCVRRNVPWRTLTRHRPSSLRLRLKGVRYDTVESGSPKAVHEIVAPFYVQVRPPRRVRLENRPRMLTSLAVAHQGKGPPSYESHSSFEKLER